jgi:hypothetical protein
MDQNVTRSSIVLIVMLIVGIHALFTGWRYRRGTYKSPYFGRPTFTLYAELGLSGGLLFIILAISTFLTRDMAENAGVTTAVSILIYLGVTAVAVNWLLGIFSSRLINPAWVNWLETNYTSQQIDILRQHTQEIGLRQWELQVQTRTDLQAWITAVLALPDEHPPSQ